MNLEADKRELLQALEACLQSADDLGLALVGIYLSHAIELVRAEDSRENPLTNQA
jgi:hypothetical protein